MSVINDMLKDLDQRRRLTDAQQRNTVVADLRYDPKDAHARRPYFTIILGAVVGIGLVGLGFFYVKKPSATAVTRTDIVLPKLELQPVRLVALPVKPVLTEPVPIKPEKSTAIKKVHRVDPELMLQKQYKKALALVNSGDVQQAQKILHTALQQAPNYQSFIELQANLLLSQGQYQSAFILLDRIQPALADAPDFYSIKAALYRKTNRLQQAQRLYQQLLGLEPTNSTWWLGLAASFEQEDKLPEAIKAYQQATITGQLAANVQLSVEQHLQQLQG